MYGHLSLWCFLVHVPYRFIRNVCFRVFFRHLPVLLGTRLTARLTPVHAANTRQPPLCFYLYCYSNAEIHIKRFIVPKTRTVHYVQGNPPSMSINVSTRGDFAMWLFSSVSALKERLVLCESFILGGKKHSVLEIQTNLATLPTDRVPSVTSEGFDERPSGWIRYYSAKI